MSKLEFGSKEATEIKPENHPEYGKWRLNLGVITVSGKPGAGQSTLIRWIAEIYGIPNGNKIEVGQIFRDITNAGRGTEYMSRDPEVDKAIDDMQKNIIENTSAPTLINLNSTRIIEGKLAGTFVREKKEINPSLPVIAILLKALEEERLRRLQKRIKKSTENLSAETSDRELKDLIQWGDVHPGLENPYDERYFDFVIDTDGKNPRKVFDVLHEWLKENGLISKKEEKAKDLPVNGPIFPNPNA